METTHQHPENDSHTMTNFLSFILYCLIGMFEVMQSITIESAYTWFFRVLSTISVVMVIIINWPKVMAVLRKKR